MRKWFRLGAVAATTMALLLGVVPGAVLSNAHAASNTVMVNPYNGSLGRYIPVREGGYTSSTDKGFGYLKINIKHNIYDLDALSFMYKAPARSEGGGQYVLMSYARRWVCSSTCVLKEEVPVRSIANTNSYPTYHGYTVNGVLGAQTAYCQGYYPRCPDWVNVALSVAGSSRTTSASDPALEGEATHLADAERSATPSTAYDAGYAPIAPK